MTHRLQTVPKEFCGILRTVNSDVLRDGSYTVVHDRGQRFYLNIIPYHRIVSLNEFMNVQ